MAEALLKDKSRQADHERLADTEDAVVRGLAVEQDGVASAQVPEVELAIHPFDHQVPAARRRGRRPDAAF